MSRTASPLRVSDFLLRLADEPALLDAHRRDPRSTLQAAGFADDVVASFLSGPEGVAAIVNRELAADPQHRRLIVLPRMTLETTPAPDEPGPPPQPPPPPPQPQIGG